jgi:hypothetical protein
LFEGNRADGYGGAVMNFYAKCDTDRCFFINNTALCGGAIYNRGASNNSPITNCVFSENEATQANGGGGAICDYFVTDPLVVNCTFNDNAAVYGKAVLCYLAYGRYRNCIMWGDSGGQFYNYYGYPTVQYSDVRGGYSGLGNIDADPLFVDAGGPDGDDGIFGNYDDGLHLKPSSPCIDAGQDNQPTDLGVPDHDAAYNERPFDYPGVNNNGTEDEYDMGAYEASKFRFTVTADNRPGVSGCRARWQYLLDEMEYEVDDEGVFHISPGDFDPPDETLEDLEDELGNDVIWFPVVGNHEVETDDDMIWIRGPGGTDNMGHYGDLRQLEHPEPRIVKEGPTGCVGTMYSFEYHNAHFIVLNEYYDGSSDSATTNGYISDATYNWLVEDLDDNTKPFVFVFGHEPVYPKHRHERVPDDDWISFWKLLNDEKVAAYFCGHTHFYSRGKVGGGGLDWEPFTWQVDAGNAGRDDGDGLTFVDVNVTDTDVQFDVWHEDHDDYGTGFEVDDSWALLDLAVPVRDSADDAEESSDGSVNLTDEALELVDNAGDVQTVGLRFREVDIPQGAEIDSAYIQFAADGVTSGTCSLTIEGEKSGNADVFEAIDDNISNETERPRTTASVTWSSVANWDDDERAGVAERTPDIGPIIQEIVGLSGADPWETGNALVIIITGTSGNLRRAFARDAYNAGRDDYAPVLYVKVSR